jgi:hypothetical protein
MLEEDSDPRRPPDSGRSANGVASNAAAISLDMFSKLSYPWISPVVSHRESSCHFSLWPTPGYTSHYIPCHCDVLGNLMATLVRLANFVATLLTVNRDPIATIQNPECLAQFRIPFRVISWRPHCGSVGNFPIPESSQIKSNPGKSRWKTFLQSQNCTKSFTTLSINPEP